jgi:hypothetical protein
MRRIVIDRPHDLIVPEIEELAGMPPENDEAR